MPDRDVLTMVIRFDVAPADQAALLEIMTESVGKVLSRQPGYLSGMILPSTDGTHVLNVTTWTDQESMMAVRHNPDAKLLAERMGAISIPNPLPYPWRREFPGND